MNNDIEKRNKEMAIATYIDVKRTLQERLGGETDFQIRLSGQSALDELYKTIRLKTKELNKYIQTQNSEENK